MKIYYILSDLKAGSNLIKGQQVADTLRKNGVDVELLTEISYEIQNSIIVFVGGLYSGYKLTPQLLDKLKSNNNKLVVDPVDNLCYIQNDLHNESLAYQFMDGIIFTNKFSESHFMENLDCKSIVIPHHYDNKIDHIDIVKNKEFGVCYAGARYSDVYFQNKPDWLDLNFGGHTDGVLDMLMKYPIHFSHRESHTIDFHFKPATKLATASSSNSLFITSKDKSVVDILGEDYPLYIDGDIKKTNKIFNHIQHEYNRGNATEYLNLITNIRPLVDIDMIYIDYINFFKSL